MTEKVGFNASNEAVQSEIRRDVEAAISNVFTVLRARIDQFGVVQPNTTFRGYGTYSSRTARSQRSSTCSKASCRALRSQFWNMYEGAEVLPFLVSVNERMRDLVEAEKVEVTPTESFEEFSIDGTAEKRIPPQQMLILQIYYPTIILFRSVPTNGE